MPAFKLIQTTSLTQPHGLLYHYHHQASGANVFYLDTADKEKTFTLQFRTLPTSDNGVAHVIEHSVFCGSRHYPVKDPFVELMKGSMNTYLNAITYPDRTVYPFATTNDQEYLNLMDIYLDAVFAPNFLEDERILAQEGWHYEFDEAGQLMVNGIVYNEMKGALASPETRLDYLLQTRLFDNAYQWNAAGDPKAIPSLTQAQMVAFYHQYYQPANAQVMLYGHLDIQAVLAKLDAYLAPAAQAQVSAPIREAEASQWQHAQVIHETYPVLKGEAGLELLGIGIAHSRYDQLCDNLGLKLLMSMLFGLDSSPIKACLLDHQLIQDMTVNVDESLRQPMTSLTLLGTPKTALEQVQTLIRTQLTQLVQTGLDQPLIEAVLQQWRFMLAEGFAGQDYPKGIFLSLEALASVDRGVLPQAKLNYQAYLEQIAAQVGQGYFEGLIQTYLLDNPHWLFVTLTPDEAQATRDYETEKAQLAQLQAALSESDRLAIQAGVAQLRQAQLSPNSEAALATIPKLSLSDLPDKLDTCPYHAVEAEIPAYELVTEATEIAYVTLVFKQAQLELADLPYLSILSALLGYLPTSKRDVQALTNELMSLTGHTYYTARVYRQGQASPQVTLQLTSKYLKAVEPAVIPLLLDITYHTQFEDEDRLYNGLANLLYQFEMDVLENGSEIASTRLRAYFDVKGVYESYLTGVDYYRCLQTLVNDFDTHKRELIAKLQTLYQTAFSQEAATVFYQGADSQAFMQQFVPQLVSLAQPTKVAVVPEILGNQAEAFLTTNDINYISQGYNIQSLGYVYSGALEVARKILNSHYLWDQLRVVGGAYGAELMTLIDGTLVATSYRDPNISQTLDVFGQMGTYLRQLSQNAPDLTPYIIGTCSEFARPITPDQRMELVLLAHLEGYTDQVRQQLWQAIKSCEWSHLLQCAAIIDQAMAQHQHCAVISSRQAAEAETCFKVQELAQVEDNW